MPTFNTFNPFLDRALGITPSPRLFNAPPIPRGAVEPIEEEPRGIEAFRPLVQQYFGDLGPRTVENMLKIMQLESGGNPRAHNQRGEDSRGLFQINVAARPAFGNLDLFDPEENVRRAREVFNTQGFNAWLNASRRLGLTADDGGGGQNSGGVDADFTDGGGGGGGTSAGTGVRPFDPSLIGALTPQEALYFFPPGERGGLASRGVRNIMSALGVPALAGGHYGSFLQGIIQSAYNSALAQQALESVGGGETDKEVKLSDLVNSNLINNVINTIRSGRLSSIADPSAFIQQLSSAEGTNPFVAMLLNTPEQAAGIIESVVGPFLAPLLRGPLANVLDIQADEFTNLQPGNPLLGRGGFLGRTLFPGLPLVNRPATVTRPTAAKATPALPGESGGAAARDAVRTTEPIPRVGPEPGVVRRLPGVQAPLPQTYVVEAGDTLWDIAERMLGDGNRWREIYELNRELLADPNLIRPGQELRLPA